MLEGNDDDYITIMLMMMKSFVSSKVLTFNDLCLGNPRYGFIARVHLILEAYTLRWLIPMILKSMLSIGRRHDSVYLQINAISGLIPK